MTLTLSRFVNLQISLTVARGTHLIEPQTNSCSRSRPILRLQHHPRHDRRPRLPPIVPPSSSHLHEQKYNLSTWFYHAGLIPKVMIDRFGCTCRMIVPSHPSLYVTTPGKNDGWTRDISDVQTDRFDVTVQAINNGCTPDQGGIFRRGVIGLQNPIVSVPSSDLRNRRGRTP